MALSLRQVRYFIAVAENGSVTGAAQQLSVSQSTVTEAIKGLEDELGVRLIERQARGVSLSYKGQQFLRHAHRILAEEIGRAHVCTPVTNAHLVCRLLLEKKKTQKP